MFINDCVCRVSRDCGVLDGPGFYESGKQGIVGLELDA